MSFVKFTNASGTEIWVNPAQVVSVQSVTSGTTAITLTASTGGGVSTIVSVADTPANVVKALQAAGRPTPNTFGAAPAPTAVSGS